MINIKELSIGNYLRVAKEGLFIKKGTIIKINGIDSEDKIMEKGLVGVISCHPLDKYQFDGGIWLAYLEPIEITPEILEKSGWKISINDINPMMWFAYLDEKAVIVKSSDLVTVITDRGMKTPFKYVHQLQNILTLCGIDKEIEL